MANIRVGIAGYGVVGKKRRACIDAHEHFELVGVCDRVFESDGIFEDGVKYFTEYKKLLSEELDTLFICMTNDIACEVTIAALEQGLHVFCEKPPGRSVEEIAEVRKCEKQHPHLKLMYGFNHRHHDSVREALKIIQSGEFGKIINMRGVYGKSKLITFNQPDWRTKREIAGGGVLLDQGIHLVDLMRLFAGEFTQVHSFVSNNFWGYDVEDNAYAIMKTDEGIVGMINSSATQWRHRFNLDINMEKGSLILGGILSGSKSYGAETLTIVTADPDNDMGDPKEQLIRYNKDTSWEDEVTIFAECIVKDKPVESGSSQDAYNTMCHVFNIYYSDPQWREQYDIPEPKQ